MLASRELPERWSNTDKSADRCQHRQRNQRHPHRLRRFMRYMRAMVPVTMSVGGNVMSDVFMYRSNMLARFVSRTISGRRQHRIMRRLAFVERRGVRLVRFPTCGMFEETFLAPE